MKNPPAELCKFRKAIEDEFKVHPETKQDYITLAHKFLVNLMCQSYIILKQNRII